MGISDEIEATAIVIDERTILEIKATITFISITFDNVSRAMILATESAKNYAASSSSLFCLSPVAFYLGGAPSKGFATLSNVLKFPSNVPK